MKNVFKKLFKKEQKKEQKEKSNMETWAEREVAIACARERNNAAKDDWDYGCACYESALKAFNCLRGDGHDGFSIGMTKNILNRLIEAKPITPIEDTDDVWNDISDISGLESGERMYQCKRMGSLFKYVYADGTVKYRDIDNNYCVSISNPNDTYSSGLVRKVIMDEMFPITMPYYPEKQYKFYCDDFLTDRANGDYDTVGVFYVVTPGGVHVEINRFFKESPDGWDEITEAEYRERETIKIV